MRQTRYPRMVLSLIVIVIWLVLDRREPFRSHFWLTLLGSGMSAVAVGLFIYWLSRRKSGNPAA